MRHRLWWFIHLRAHGQRKGDEHPAYAPRGGMALLHFFFFLGLVLESHVQASPIFIRLSSMAVARSFAGGFVNFRKLRTSGFVDDVKFAHNGQK